MLTGEELMDKMRRDAQNYRALIRSHKYVQAKSLYNKVHAVAVYAGGTVDELEELFGRYAPDPDDVNAPKGLYDRKSVAEIGFLALKQEREENRRGNPTQIMNFEHYLPESLFHEK